MEDTLTQESEQIDVVDKAPAEGLDQKQAFRQSF
jgi:hypothetical protein